MRATLTLTGPAAGIANFPSARSFGAAGGSIGRGPENDWVLPDPGRLLSKTHCVLGFEHGRFTLTDVSTNGVFLNGSADRIGRGETVVLADGDRLQLGDFVVQVSIEATDAPQGGQPTDGFAAMLLGGDAAPLPVPDDPFADDDAPGKGPGDDVFAQVYSPRTRAFEDQGLIPPDDSLFGSRPTPSDFEPYSQPDNVAADQQFFRPPSSAQDTAGPAIPDDWDSDLPPVEGGAGGGMAPAPFEAPPGDDSPFGASVPLAPGLGGGPAGGGGGPAAIPDDWDSEPLSAGDGQAMPAGAAAPPPVSSARVPSGGGSGALRAFLDGAGLGGLEMPEDQAAEVMRRAGVTFRALVAGVREALSARTALKGELRVDQTMLRAEGNNPLKFSQDLDEALIALILLSVPGFLPADQAVREGFQDLKAHQMGMFAGMQAAVKSLLQQFDPDHLAGRLDHQSLLTSLVPAARKSKYWELYENRYHEIAAEAEQDFHGVFGKEFAAAYRTHIKKQ